MRVVVVQTRLELLSEGTRVQNFWSEAQSNGLFLLSLLALAYLFASLMVRYIPAEAIAGVVGGKGLQLLIISAFIGAPAYLNGYAAPAIVSGLMEQGMVAGAALTFMIAGGVTSIPAMTTVLPWSKSQSLPPTLALGLVSRSCQVCCITPT